jgi:hypothetical protein
MEPPACIATQCEVIANKMKGKYPLQVVEKKKKETDVFGKKYARFVTQSFKL